MECLPDSIRGARISGMNITTPLGVVEVNGFSVKHCRKNGHLSPMKTGVVEALKNGHYSEITRVPSGWRGTAATNIVLLVDTAHRKILVVLKSIGDVIFMVTAYPPHRRQMEKLLGHA